MSDNSDQAKDSGPSKPSSVTVFCHSPDSADASDVRTVVSVRGEQDLATAEGLSAMLLWASTLTDGDLVIDLSEVPFMGTSTVTVIVATRAALAEQSRSLRLRAPSRCARRVIELCGLADLIEPPVIDLTAVPGAADALGTWVEVPATDRASRGADAPVPAPTAAPALVSTAGQGEELAREAQADP